MDDKKAMHELTVKEREWCERVERRLLMIEMDIDNLASLVRIIMTSRKVGDVDDKG